MFAQGASRNYGCELVALRVCTYSPPSLVQQIVRGFQNEPSGKLVQFAQLKRHGGCP
jgi:hypothetical protein